MIINVIMSRIGSRNGMHGPAACSLLLNSCDQKQQQRRAPLLICLSILSDWASPCPSTRAVGRQQPSAPAYQTCLADCACSPSAPLLFVPLILTPSTVVFLAFALLPLPLQARPFARPLSVSGSRLSTFSNREAVFGGGFHG